MNNRLPIIGFLACLLLGCEQQMPARTVQTTPEVTEDPREDGEVDTDALRRPGTTGYYEALSGAKGSAERLKDKIDDYNRQVEEQADDVFND